MQHPQMIHPDIITNKGTLYIAFELSNKKWKLRFGNGYNNKRKRTVEARNYLKVQMEILAAKKHFKLPENAPVFSCYEAGRDGFWIHRFLQSIGVANYVVDSSSIEVNRRARRAKTDRIDAQKLLNMLIRYKYGDLKLWSVLHVPDEDDEDAKRINRERDRLLKEAGSHTSRIKSLLSLHGVTSQVTKNFLEDLKEVRLWNGEELPELLTREMTREYERYMMVQKHLDQINAEKQAIMTSGTEQANKIIELQRLKGIGPISSWDLVFEFFWRKFRNGKEVGSAAGLAPTPYNSGDSESELGISKAGNKRIRAKMIELSWLWLRYQPRSRISMWFAERFAKGGKRMRRVGIVAVARKLLVALWRFIEQGVVPEGAIFKS